MSGIDLEIQMDSLGDLPLYPPRRRFIDFVPTFIMSWVRRKFSKPKATPREAWAVSSMLLRVAYARNLAINTAVEVAAKPYYVHEEVAAKITEQDKDDDPWRWS